MQKSCDVLIFCIFIAVETQIWAPLKRVINNGKILV